MDWQPLGSLQALYLRADTERAPWPVSVARAVAGHGLAGDRHACALSPRQLLLAASDAYRHWQLPLMALRENLRVDFPTSGLRSGDLLRVGSEVLLWLTFQCEPCSLLERRCPGTLKTIGAERGMLARVLRGGELRAGDAIALARGKAPVLSEVWQDRILQVARAVPKGHWISYGQLALMAGVQPSYCRAFPRVLSRLPADVARRVGKTGQAGAATVWPGAGFFDTGPLPVDH